MLPSDRLVCAFVEPQQVGLQFKKWLLHVTVVPWFRSDNSSEAISNGLKQAVSNLSPFEVKVVDEAMFGPRKNRPAMLLEQPSPFDDIEHKVRNYLHKKHAFLIDETTKRRHHFHAHVTVQAYKSVTAGSTLRFDRLYIVEQKGDYKEIVSEIRLGNE